MIDGGVEAGPAAAAAASVGFFSEGRRLCQDEIMGVCAGRKARCSAAALWCAESLAVVRRVCAAAARAACR